MPGGLTVSGLLRPRVWQLDFFAEASRDLLRQAASLLVERLGRPSPGHELVETRGGPEIDELGEHVGEVGLRIDAVQFAGLDERGDAAQFSAP